MSIGLNIISNKCNLEQMSFGTNVIGENAIRKKCHLEQMLFWTNIFFEQIWSRANIVAVNYFLISKCFNFHGIFSNSSNSWFLTSSNIKSILFILSEVRTIKTKHTMTNVCCLFWFTKLEFFEFSKKFFFKHGCG